MLEDIFSAIAFGQQSEFSNLTQRIQHLESGLNQEVARSRYYEQLYLNEKAEKERIVNGILSGCKEPNC